jgi:hypothetical protein
MSTPAASNDTLTIFMATVGEKPVQINVTRKAGASNWTASSAGIRGIVMSTRGAQHAAQTFSDSICGSTVVEVQLTPVAPPPPQPTKKEQLDGLLGNFEYCIRFFPANVTIAREKVCKFVDDLIEANDRLESKCALLENDLFMANHGN